MEFTFQHALTSYRYQRHKETCSAECYKNYRYLVCHNLKRQYIRHECYVFDLIVGKARRRESLPSPRMITMCSSSASSPESQPTCGEGGKRLLIYGLKLYKGIFCGYSLAISSVTLIRIWIQYFENSDPEPSVLYLNLKFCKSKIVFIFLTSRTLNSR